MVEGVVRIAASRQDPLAEEVVMALVQTGGSDRRRRELAITREGSNETRWSGQIMNTATGVGTPIEVVLVDSLDQITSPELVLLGATARLGRGRFATSPSRQARLPLAVSVNGSTAGSKRIVIMPQREGGNRHANMLRQVACEVMAFAERRRQFEPWMLRFPQTEGDFHRATIARWVNSGTPTTAISAACLNATEDRRGIVKQFSATAVRLLVEMARATFAQMPHTQAWHISTFGVGDVDFLQEFGIQRVLLPYMVARLEEGEAGVMRVKDDMHRNYALMEELVAQLNAALPFPVTLHEIREGVEELDVPTLIKAAERRAEQMMPYLLQHPPKIFASLPEEEWPVRVRQEAFLYMLDSLRYAGREGFWQLAVEVHGGYIAAGNLDRTDDGRRWPLAFLPDAVRQHWGDWTDRHPNTAKQRRNLAGMLRVAGYHA